MSGRGTPRGTGLDAFGLAAGACAVAGTAMAWLRLVPAMLGFGLFVLGGLTAAVVAVAAVARLARGRGIGLGGATGLLVGAGFVLIAVRGARVPAINDFTTDLADPPAFRYAGTLPPNVGRDLSYPASFAPIQRACCADLRGARVPGARDEAFARARSLAQGTPGWTVTQADAAAGVIEVVATTRVFGFQDDIVIRVREEGGDTSRVDMRSKSRDGRGDIGANAARIRAFVAALESQRP
jgi:hypothetical protein